MILLIDSGNTALKYSFVIEGQIKMVSSIARLNDSFSKQLRNIIPPKSTAPLKAIYISNVAGKNIEEQLTSWCREIFKVDPVYAFVSKNFNGLVNAYSPVEQLGIDRWLALIAATDCFKRPICVVDVGTAVTIDAIDETEQYIGGIILPGLMLMRQSLQQNTADINLIQDQTNIDFFAKNTQQGITAGVTLAITAAIESMIEKLQEQTNQKVLCVLTGGAAVEIKPYLPQTVKHVPDLVLKGLYLWGKGNDLDR